MTSPRTKPRRRRPRRRGDALLWTIAVLAAATLVVGVVGVVTATTGAASPTAITGTSLDGKQVTLDPGESGTAASASHAVADTGVQLVVPSVGLDVPLGELDAVDGQITPPGFREAYRVRNLGVSLADRADGTVFVVMHSLRNGAIGPGNLLIDVDGQRSEVAVGSSVRIGDARWTVTGSERITKATVAADADVWADEPGRLLLITCLQRPDGSASVDNVVIEATLDR
ncbi:class F sortase [Curtobacterium sp. VKM Ac-2884]|uniref:class F sortase n=1 Tax=Curtobacterium sp. VKM Ac-2884 TaxID=2783818 RepID=UPI001E2840CD|nr:class F sortase [Curtobacterium sp. VKM Ac-2884]